LLKNGYIDIPHIYLTLPLGVIPLEFCRNFWHKKTTVAGPSHCVVLSDLEFSSLCRLCRNHLLWRRRIRIPWHVYNFL